MTPAEVEAELRRLVVRYQTHAQYAADRLEINQGYRDDMLRCDGIQMGLRKAADLVRDHLVKGEG